MKISACMIAKNEEKNIARCIESYQDIVNEIIVVDTGSTDGTVDVAKGMGAKVFHYVWNNNFAQAKNFALEQAKGDWIIFLDADEYFYDKTERNIPPLLKSIHANSKIQGINCKFYHVDEDENNKLKNSDYLLRIFRNHKKIRFVGDIHEEIRYENKPLRAAGTPPELIKVYHTGYSSKVLHSKLERNMKPLLDKIEKGSADALTHFYLSDCYFGLSDYENTIKHARLAIEKGLKTYSHNVKPYLTIVSSMIYLKRPFKEIEEEINLGIQRFPNHPDFYRLLGTNCFSEAKYVQAIHAYEKFQELHKTYTDREIYSENLYVKDIFGHLGMLYSFKNQYDQSLEYFIKAIREKKTDVTIFEHLMRLIKNEQPEEVIFLLKSIYDDNSKEDIEFLVTNLSKLRMGIVLMYYHNIWLNRFGQEDVTTMYMLLSIGKYEEAFKHFSQAMVMEKGEWAPPYAVITAILTGRREYANLIFDLLNPALKNILEAYLDLKSDIPLNSENLNYYINILNEFVLLKASPQIDKMIGLKGCFSVDISKAIGDVLLNNMVYGKAIIQYLDALERGGKDDSEIYFKLGNAYYKTYDYVNALTMFKKAIEQGYCKDGIYDYLQWISEQCSDERIRNEIGFLAVQSGG